MQRLNLLNVDLNLLVAFDALVVEGSVSRAASRIGVSQPAMSRSLKQLRELFGDVLFRRTSDGMLPTPRAVELARLLRPSLENISSTLSQKLEFNPAKAERKFVLAMPDMAATLVLPTLCRELNRTAPGIELRIISAGNREAMAKVENGQAEFALGVYEHLSSSVCSENMLPLREVCIADPGNNALVSANCDLDSFLSLPHVAVSINDDFGTPVDTLLATLGLQRQIVYTTPFFTSVPRMVVGTSLVAVVAEALLQTMPESAMLMHFPVPLPLDPVMSKLIWHKRWDGDPGHEWFRRQISRASQSAILQV